VLLIEIITLVLEIWHFYNKKMLEHIRFAYDRGRERDRDHDRGHERDRDRGDRGSDRVSGVLCALARTFVFVLDI